VYYYTLTGSFWSYQSKLLAFDGVVDDYFGISVSIHNTNALIGANGDADTAIGGGKHNEFIYYM
jgi:hypothetical protein